MIDTRARLECLATVAIIVKNVWMRVLWDIHGLHRSVFPRRGAEGLAFGDAHCANHATVRPLGEKASKIDKCIRR